MFKELLGNKKGRSDYFLTTRSITVLVCRCGYVSISPYASRNVLGLFNLYQRFIRAYSVTFLDIYFFDGSGYGRLDLCFHFHRFGDK